MGKARISLSRKAAALPESPGVYLMKDARGEVIYVGKAKDLRARVRGYFQPAAGDWRLITRQLDEVADLDVLVAGSDKEALILECNFIKTFRPKYNVLYRDDKSFVSIKIPLGEPWPRPVVTRKLEDRKALYFGPYANARAARETVRVLQDVFPLRKCSARQCRQARRPCIYGQLGKCLAPCCAQVPQEQYRALVDQVTQFLRGKSDELVCSLRRQMQKAAQGREFERAARLRDRIRAVEATLEKQRAGASGEKTDRDVFGLAATDDEVWIAVLFVRDGNLQDAASYSFRARLGSPEVVFGSFLNQFYAANQFIPPEVLLPVESEDADVLEQWLSEKRGRKVRVIRPRRGEKRRLVELANRNARQAETLSATDKDRTAREAESLQSTLGLSAPPRTIECFDVSTMQGREAVGSMVALRDGAPDKSSYRRYRIRQVQGQDDCAMLAEVLTRRYRHVGRGSAGAQERGAPDLIVVDGGRGQLSAARRVLAQLGLDSCQSVALAKARSRRGRTAAPERVFIPGRRGPVPLPEHSWGTRLITRVRDEAHRFAVAYHRKLRDRAAMQSPLTQVRGVGPKLAARLLQRFGSLEAVAGASVEDLAGVSGVSERLAQVIHARLRG